jgi:hypothetical protein
MLRDSAPQKRPDVALLRLALRALAAFSTQWRTGQRPYITQHDAHLLHVAAKDFWQALLQPAFPVTLEGSKVTAILFGS